MFSWATTHFEKITNTLAPPPDDAAGRFVYCCQKDDENGALACVPELPGAGAIVNAAKGQVPLHVACQASMLTLIRTLLQQPGASLDQLDAKGNTPLHAACTSSKTIALDVVKLLVSEFQANVTTKNSNGETPYDVATLNSIRQYLLPIQLQKETQEALDNGGVGLPPGIDLGGLRIANNNARGGAGGGGPPTLAPPPTMGGMMMGAPLPPPPMGGSPGFPGMSPPVATAADAIPTFLAPTPPNASATTTAANPPVLTTPPPMSFSQRSASSPVIGSATTTTDIRNNLPSAPRSGPRTDSDYALSGHSSAAIYKPQGRRFIQPDGFHSSSSDKRLQEKYGHEQTGWHVPKAVPPPPSSGNAPLSGNYASAHNSTSAPPSLGAYNNPFAGGARHLTGRRYVAVDPVTGQQSITPPPSGGVSGAAPQYAPSYLPAATPPHPPVTSPNVTMFLPGAPPTTYASPSTISAAPYSGTFLAPPAATASTTAPAPVVVHPPVPAYNPSPPQVQGYQGQSVYPPAVQSSPTYAAPNASWSSPQESTVGPPPPAMFGSGRAAGPGEAGQAAAASLFSSPSSEGVPNEEATTTTTAAMAVSALAPASFPTPVAFDPSRSLSAESAASLFSSPSTEDTTDDGSAPQVAPTSSPLTTTTTTNATTPTNAPPEPQGAFPRPPVLSSTGRFALPPNMQPPQLASVSPPAAAVVGRPSVASAATLFASTTTQAVAAQGSELQPTTVETAAETVPAIAAQSDAPSDGAAAVNVNDDGDDELLLDEVPLTPGSGGKPLCQAVAGELQPPEQRSDEAAL